MYMELLLRDERKEGRSVGYQLTSALNYVTTFIKIQINGLIFLAVI